MDPLKLLYFPSVVFNSFLSSATSLHEPDVNKPEAGKHRTETREPNQHSNSSPKATVDKEPQTNYSFDFHSKQRCNFPPQCYNLG